MRFARVVWKMLQNRGGVVGASCTFRGHLALSEGTSVGHREISPCIFCEFCLVVAGVEWRAHTKFQANRRSFGGWTRVLKKLRRFGSYRQNFILEWPSMWCSNGDEILCGDNSLLEEHLVKNSHDFHARFGRCFKTAGESWAHCARYVGIWHSRRGPLWDTGRLARAFLAKFYMVIAAVEWGAQTKFQANRRLFGE